MVSAHAQLQCQSVDSARHRGRTVFSLRFVFSRLDRIDGTVRIRAFASRDRTMESIQAGHLVGVTSRQVGGQSLTEAVLRACPPFRRQAIIGRLANGDDDRMVAAACVAGAGVWWWPDSASGHGRYLADVSGCHGPGLSGGQVAGPDNLPPAANLTPAGLGRWTQADFVRAIREGRRPDGSAVNEFMPWRAYGAMTDAELESLSLYLRSVPAKPSAGR
jgi:mono/diheme cytochrome c family protein